MLLKLNCYEFGYRLQAALNEVEDPLLAKNTVCETTWLVALVREDQQFVVLLCPNQRVQQPCGVPKVHVFVNQAMDQ